VDRDAAGCVLAEGGHALVAARISTSLLRARLYELTQVSDQAGGWLIRSRARDPWLFAKQALTDAGWTADQRAALRLHQIASRRG
jgi:hypothetical protein